MLPGVSLEGCLPEWQYRPNYMALSKCDKAIYNLMLQAVLRHEASVKFDGLVECRCLAHIWECVYHDVPEMLKVAALLMPVGARKGDLVSDIGLKYVFTLEEHRRRLLGMESVTRNVCMNASRACSEEEMVRFMHDWFLEECVYENRHIPEDHNASGPFLSRRCVCEGFAYGFKYLCDRMHIACVVVDGYADVKYERGRKGLFDGNHSWNVVRVDGRWYQIDVSHDVCCAGSEEERRYYLIGDEEISVDHTFNVSRSIPRCPESKTHKGA